MENSAPVKDLKSFYNEFRASLTNTQLKKFKSLKSKENKILFVANLAKCFVYPVEAEFNHGKSIQDAKNFKNKGNVEFQNENYEKAFWFYSQAILKSSPNYSDADQETIIFFSNRSATLYHLQKYELAIRDIDFALNNNYPLHLSYKLLDRKARCLLALKKNDLAIDVFRCTITALDESKLTIEKKQKWQKDIQIMLLMLKKNEHPEKSSVPEKSRKVAKNVLDPKYEAIKADIAILFSKKMGRFAQAKTDIKAGDIVLVEDAHSAVLIDIYRSTHCHNCFKRVKILYPCPTCDQIIFCSENCAKYALSTYHLTECPILSSLWKAKISITCLIALRMITQHPVEFFLQKKNYSLKNQQSQIEEYKSKNYEAACTLVGHENERKPEDMINRIYVALFLLHCLQKSSYFRNISTTTSDKNENVHLNNDEVFIAQLLQQHLQILQFNAHEVSELVIPQENVEAPVSEFIGGALYPTLALFNHSCNPGLVRYFKGTKVIARAIRNISAGEMVAENYGAVFMTQTRNKRQQMMQERYWFTCECEACINNWPTLAEMNNSNIQLRCTIKKCGGSVTLDPGNDQLFIKCKLCFENYNILKALKTLQETDSTFTQAKNYMKSNKPEKALKEYLRILNLLDTTLVLPSKDYLICQEEIRTCYLMMGNRTFLNSK